jgi:hypothetical protein
MVSVVGVEAAHGGRQYRHSYAQIPHWALGLFTTTVKLYGLDRSGYMTELMVGYGEEQVPSPIWPSS